MFPDFDLVSKLQSRLLFSSFKGQRLLTRGNRFETQMSVLRNLPET